MHKASLANDEWLKCETSKQPKPNYWRHIIFDSTALFTAFNPVSTVFLSDLCNIYRTHTFDVSAWLPHKSPKSCSKSIKTHKMRMIFSEKAIEKRFQRWIALILNAYAYIIASLVRGNATFTRNWKRHIRRATNPFAYKTYRQSSGWEQIPIAVEQMIYSFDSGSIRLACAKNDFIIITPLAESNTHRHNHFIFRGILFWLPFWEFNRIDSTFTLT